jgi:hypothetical protein
VLLGTSQQPSSRHHQHASSMQQEGSMQIMQLRLVRPAKKARW